MPKVTVDDHKCEGAKKCLQVCPTQVFALRPVDPSLPFFVRLKVRVHGGKQANVVNESACTGCMKCVEVCPEDAIVVRLDTP